MKHNHENPRLIVVMIGGTGAVGVEVVKTILNMEKVERLTLLGRRYLSLNNEEKIIQHKIDIFEPSSFQPFLANHQIAICTLGVGEPSKLSRADFLKIDKQAVIDFASSCKQAGVKHFSLLSSVGINAKSSNFYLRSKGELVEEIISLNFNRFSIFQPSMILTPKNRYGIMQGISLKVWPLLKPILIGRARKFRGIPVEILGQSMAENISLDKSGVAYYQWDDFYEIVNRNL